MTPSIKYVAPTSRSFARTKEMLFTSFSFSKWFFLGFTAWIAHLLEQDHPAIRPLVRLFIRAARPAIGVGGAVAVLVTVGLTIVILLLWVRSRGKFMFLDNIVHNRAEIREPWKGYRAHGNSLFRWELLYHFYAILAFLATGVFMVGFIIYRRKLRQWGLASVAMVFSFANLLVIQVLFFFYIRILLEDFVIPMMYRGSLTTSGAWQHVLALHGKTFWKFVLYVLWKVLVIVGVIFCVCGLFLVTCCIGFALTLIPFVGSLWLLPVPVFLRATGPEFLKQFGKQYDTFTAPATAPTGPLRRGTFPARKGWILMGTTLTLLIALLAGAIVFTRKAAKMPRKPRRNAGPVLPPGGGLGRITREWWNGIPGTSVDELINHPNFPDTPTGTDELTRLKAPRGIGDNYGTRIRGLVHPPLTGVYTFWITGDDNCQLWLSTNDNPANRVMIAYVSGWTWEREWTKFPQQKSIRLKLNSGQAYYIEVLHKEGDGADHVTVGWQINDGRRRVIEGQYLSPMSEVKVGLGAVDPLALKKKEEWERRIMTGDDDDAPLPKPTTGLQTGNPDLRVLCATPNGRMVIAGGRETEMGLWDTQTKKKQNIELPAKLQAAAISPDGTTAAVAVKNGQVLMYSLNGLANQQSLRPKGRSARALAYSPDGNRLVVGSVDKKLQIWDIASGKTIAETGVPSVPRCLAISPDGSRIACGVSTGEVHLLNGADLTQITILKGHDFAAKSVDFSPDGSQVLSGSDDLSIRLWKSTGESVRSFTGHFSLVTGVKFLADGKRCVSSSMDGTVRVWELQTGKELKKIELTNDGISSLASANSRTTLFAAGRDGVVYTIKEEDLK